MVLTKENNKLEHLAIIMDGNGRWAARRGLPRSMGHRKGAEVVKEITRAAGELGIKYLTLYAFSTENWNRSEDEVKTLMGLLRDYLQSDLKEVQENNVRIRFIGEREMLDADIVRKMAEIEADTLRNTGMTLCIALSYGSRQEIVNAVKKTAALVKEGDIVPGNSHFDTTKGHIEGRKAIAWDVTIDEAKDTQLEIPFKGNLDPKKLEAVLAEHADKIPFIIVTITNNTAGGPPASMKNIKEVRAIADKYGKRVLFDSARFAENAYFIKTREEGYQNKTIKEIVKEMFDNADGMTMSAKKDAIVNMGGFIATRHQDWFEGAKGFCVQYEGYLTYGGMNGRDMNALAIGLDENTEFDNLETRIKQVEYLAKRLDEFGIPYQRPAGGHALFVDAPKVLTHVPKEEFPAQTLTVELYLEAGIRGCEIGYILADRDPVTRENRFGGLDLLRLAIPRRVYTNNHMDVIAVALKNVFDRREQITRGFQITWEAPLMRHFTVQLERAK